MATLLRDVPLARRTTLRLGGTARAEVVLEPEDLRDAVSLERALESAAAEAGPGARLAVLGRGSNLLARDGFLDLLLVRAPSVAPEVLYERGEIARVRVAAGTLLPRLLGFCGGRGLSGLERLAGIPGSVGGAVAMNAGSYGTSFAERLVGLRIWSRRRGLETLKPADWQAGYRSFHLTRPLPAGEPWLVLEVELELDLADPAQVRETAKATFRTKKAVQPVTAWTCGCAFKNPPGASAGRLLDQAGLRGARLGGVGLSERHANFLVHHGGGTAGQALELLESARSTVAERFGVDLELEVEVLR